MKFNYRLSAYIALGALAGALATVSINSVAGSAKSDLPSADLQKFANVFAIIKSEYVDPVSSNKLMTDAVSGMVSSLDPHSQYFNQKELEEFKESTSGQFVGLGIEIMQEDGYIKIVSPIEGSPAEKAGLKSNDLITRINDRNVKSLSLNESVTMMRGKPNTKVTLTIFRKSTEKTFSVTLLRKEIIQQSVRSKLILPDYAWIRVSQFQDHTPKEFTKQVNKLYKENPSLKGLVLDLRNDPGGLLTSAIAISSAFLPPNITVVSTKGQTPQSNQVFKSKPSDYLSGNESDPLAGLPSALKKVPLVVLVNGGSASASEIVAGALQDTKRATIMGSKSFGKGSVQTFIPLPDNTGIKITTSLYYTPNGVSIQLKGIEPDILVDEEEHGNPYSILRVREEDLANHLPNGKENESKEKTLAKDRENALKKLEDEGDKVDKKKAIEYGSKNDFALTQALNFLRGAKVITHKVESNSP